MEALVAIAQQFNKTAIDLSALGNGLINDTYLVQTSSKPFVLQRINHSVFPQPAQIMANLSQPKSLQTYQRETKTFVIR